MREVSEARDLPGTKSPAKDLGFLLNAVSGHPLHWILGVTLAAVWRIRRREQGPEWDGSVAAMEVSPGTQRDRRRW